MFERIDQLLERDTRARWRIILTTVVVVAFAGLLPQSDSLETSVILDIALGCVVFFGQVAAYMAWQTEARCLVLRPYAWMLRSSGVLAAAVAVLFLVLTATPK